MTMKLEYLNDKAYITRKNLASLLKVSIQRMIGYEKMDNPLRRADIGHKVIHYDLLYAVKWHNSEIDTNYRPRPGVETSDSSEDGEEYRDGDKITSKNAKKAKELEEAKIKLRERKKLDIVIKEMKGQLIDIDDVDKDMATLAVMLRASHQNYEKFASVELFLCESQEQVAKELKLAHFVITEKLDRLINKEFDCDETLFEVISTALDEMDKNATPKSLIDKMKGIK